MIHQLLAFVVLLQKKQTVLPDPVEKKQLTITTTKSLRNTSDVSDGKNAFVTLQNFTIIV